MSAPRILLRKAGTALLLLCLALPAAAQIEDQLSSYTGDNATGYLQPIADAFGSALNDGIMRSAYIPPSGFHVSLEVRVMGVYFDTDDETFTAVAEHGFTPLNPEDLADAPTIVGSTDAMIVDGEGGAMFAFPAGLDIGSFGLAVPQLRISGFKGTEAIIRYIAVETGDAEIGDINLLGLGLRHSLSQYMSEDFPVDLAAGFLWQKFNVGQNTAGDDLISSKALSFGLQASKRYGGGVFEPYAGIGLDNFNMDVAYENLPTGGGDPVNIDLDFEGTTNFHLLFGLALNFKILSLHADYNIADRNSFSLGLAVGNLGY